MEILHLTERNQQFVVERTVSLLSRGGVVVVPTDTVYGLAADVLRPDAVAKIFRIKSRSHAKALPIFVRDIAEAKHYAYIESKLVGLLGQLWPGQVTVVLNKKPNLPDLVTGGTTTVGLRIPDDPFLSAVLARVPNPLIATSANRSGMEPARSSTEVQNTFARATPRPDLIIDAGELPTSEPSTVLDLTNPKNPKILRIGATTPQRLMQLLSHWKKPQK